MRLALLLSAFAAAVFAQPVVLVIAAGTEPALLAAGGTVAAMVRDGAAAHLIRITNDDKSSWNLSPEETALRARNESEQAARLLGIREVVHLNYRAHELAEVPFTTLRDRLLLLIRHYRPGAVFLPNPYAEYDRMLDHYYAGRAAEDAVRSAAFENFLPPLTASGLKPHPTPEVYYYAPPTDPRRREPESTATFVPQPVTVPIGASLEQKIKAVQALKTSNYASAMRLKQRLESTGRRLPLLSNVTAATAAKLAEENIRGLARLSSPAPSEEFLHAGLEYQIPAKYRQ
jgi:LmbE family N-acetylglucosaminyl deacetylase